jgi:putative FmdB family regulatory protein
MPTYDYECGACGHKFEEFQSIKADPIRKCPACRKNRVKRLIGTGAGIIFKGSGFYQTDYRSESYKSAAKADAEKASGSKADTAKSAETATQTESKPAKAAETKAKSTESSKPAA